MTTRDTSTLPRCTVTVSFDGGPAREYPGRVVSGGGSHAFVLVELPGFGLVPCKVKAGSVKRVEQQPAEWEVVA